MTTDPIKIPQRFYTDHIERDLEAPEIVKATASHFYIRKDSPHLAELLDDAEHYANGGISTYDFPELFGLVSSARATARAIRKALRAA